MVEPPLHRRRVGAGRVLQLCCRSSQAAAGFDEKLRAYGEVCKNFRPVFRYFCMECFLDPAVWMEKRLAYTRSVATSSIGTVRTAGGLSLTLACPEVLKQLHQLWFRGRKKAAEPSNAIFVVLSWLHGGSGRQTHPEHSDRRAQR